MADPYVDEVPELRFRSFRSIQNSHRMRALMQYIYELEPINSPVRENYAPTLESHTLWSKLHTGRYDEYFFGYLVQQGVWKPIMGGGYEVNENGIGVLTRLFVAPHYRMRLYIQHLLKQLTLTIATKHSNDTTLYISFNKCNEALYEWFVRKQSGRSASIGKQWPEVFSVFKPVGLRTINYTEQLVCETTLQDLIQVYELSHRNPSVGNKAPLASVVPASDSQRSPEISTDHLEPAHAGASS
jgi:hypothetical protein